MKTNWTSLALDVIHYSRLYLSMIDCGPGRRAIWREIRTETATVIREAEWGFLGKGLGGRGHHG